MKSHDYADRFPLLPVPLRKCCTPDLQQEVTVFSLGLYFFVTFSHSEKSQICRFYPGIKSLKLHIAKTLFQNKVTNICMFYRI